MGINLFWPVTAICLSLVYGEFQIVKGQLSLSPQRCGSLLCQPGEYCSEFNLQCEKCSFICDKNSHNYDERHCSTYCQEFIHDKFYVRKDETVATQTYTQSNLEETVHRLETIVYILLAINVVVLFILIVICIKKSKSICHKSHQCISSCFRNLYKDKKKTETKSNNLTEVVSGNQQTPKRELKLDVTSTINTLPSLSSPNNSEVSNINDSPATISTTATSRRGIPSQDRAIDYAYDNPAMATNNSFSNRLESSF